MRDKSTRTGEVTAGGCRRNNGTEDVPPPKLAAKLREGCPRTEFTVNLS